MFLEESTRKKYWKKKYGVRTTISEVYRSSRTPRWHCGRRYWSVCSLCWTGLVCVTNDGRKSNGCPYKTTRLCWTRGWPHIGIHPGKDEGCSKIAQNSEVRVSRCMDTFSTARRAQIVCRTVKIQLFLLSVICTQHHLSHAFFLTTGSLSSCSQLFVIVSQHARTSLSRTDFTTHMRCLKGLTAQASCHSCLW